MSSAMVVHQGTAVESTRAFEPSSIEEAYRLAKLLVASRLLPRGVATPEAAFAIIATGRELGLTAMQSLRSIHIIEGKPSLSADLVCALVKGRRDVCRYFRLVESTDQVATYETHREGEPEPTRMSFTIQEAQRAGLTGKDNWKRYAPAMLRARCITALARAVYPDLAMGVYDEDELTPVPTPRPVAIVEQPRIPEPPPSSEEGVSTDIADALEASLETPTWPAFAEKHRAALEGAATMGELQGAWSTAYEAMKKLEAPSDLYAELVGLKNLRKAALQGAK